MSQVDRHFRFKALAFSTLAVSLLPVPFAASIADPVQLAGAYFGWAAALYLLAAGGTLVAALTFGRDEPMRLAWALLSASYLVLLPALLRIGPKAAGLYQAAQRASWVLPIANMISSAMAVTSLFLLARAWRATGLDGTSRAARVATRLLALLAAVVLAGPDLVERLPAALGGDVMAAGDVVTDLLDGSLFVVAAPVLHAALLLKGGLMAWPWALLTASLAAWLGYDAIGLYGAAAGLDPRALRVVEEVLRTLGTAFVFSAGVAQRWVMTDEVRSRA